MDRGAWRATDHGVTESHTCVLILSKKKKIIIMSILLLIKEDSFLKKILSCKIKTNIFLLCSMYIC